MLIVLRVFQGIGSSMTMTTGTAILISVFPKDTALNKGVNPLSILEFISAFFEKLLTVFIGFDAVLAGLAFSLEKLTQNIASISFLDFAKGQAGIKTFAGVGDAFQKGFLDVFAGTEIGRPPEGNAVARNVTNIGKVSIENKFKEQQEPDRIAFTIKDQLMRVANNPTQSKGRFLNKGLQTQVG